jgi:hypothetical protein
VSKRLASGVYFGVAYTASKMMEAGDYLNPNDARPESDLRCGQAATSGDPWHLGTAIRTGQAAGQLRSPGAQAGGGMAVQWVITYQSNQPLALPNAIRTSRSENNPRTIEEYFDRYQFAPLPPFSLNILSTRLADLRAPGIKRWDLTVMKKIRMTERVGMQLQGEFYNAWNTTHFGAPNTTVTSGNFGRITGTSLGPREIQLSARLTF